MRVAVLLVLAAAAAAVMLALPRFPQPLEYHNFADQRCFCGIPHTLNVISNLPFVLVGVTGAWYLCPRRDFTGFRKASERWPYVLFFAFIALTGIGSAYYHADPNNDRLVWDRLPLAMAFTTLFALVIAERIDYRAGMYLLAPLVLLGAGSVLYWHWSETQGAGDLRLYLFVQFFPLLALPAMLLLFPTTYTRTADLYGALTWYIAAKLLELFDRQVYAPGHIVSGHTLKHLVAAGSAYLVFVMVRKRQSLIPIANHASPLAQYSGGGG
jgi:hypothetical protein